MDLGLAVQLGTILSLLMTVGALLFAIWSFRRQMNCNIFLTYTRRYEEIIGSFPAAALESRLKLGEALPQPSEALSVCILKYLNLCSEEFALYQKGYLAKDIWKMWEAELVRTLRSPLLQREWKRLRAEFKADPLFFAFVEATQATAPNHKTTSAPATPLPV